MLKSRFKQYSDDLDSFNASKEAVYKMARDITQAGKKQIFFLHRVKLSEGHAAYIAHLDEARAEIASISKSLLYPQYRLLSPELVKWEYQQLGLSSPVKMDDQESATDGKILSLYWVLSDKYSFSLEELQEGMTFYWFLRYGTLMTAEEVNVMVSEDMKIAQTEFYENQNNIQTEYTMSLNSNANVGAGGNKKRKTDAPVSSNNNTSVTTPNTLTQAQVTNLFTQVPTATLPIQQRELLLGYWDLSGELMRFATMNPSQLIIFEHGVQNVTVSIYCVNFQCELKGQLDNCAAKYHTTLNLNSRSSQQKSRILTDSVMKIENLCYEWTSSVAEYGEENMLRILELQANNIEPVDE